MSTAGLEVWKFGGASLADAKAMRDAVHRIRSHRGPLVVVASALAGVTDLLLRAADAAECGDLAGAAEAAAAFQRRHHAVAHALLTGTRRSRLLALIEDSARELTAMCSAVTVIGHLTPRVRDVVVARGERISARLLAATLQSAGVSVTYVDAVTIVRTDDRHGGATPLVDATARLARLAIDPLTSSARFVVPGYIGQAPDGSLTTLGRGGSDLTAIALAAALKADLCQIFTDVDGVYTADPRIVKNARKLDEISYDEMLELASLGSKVMQSRSVEFAKKYGVVFEVRSSFNHNPGTIVKEETKNMENVVVRGVSIEKNQAKFTMRQIPDRPGNAAKIFTALAGANLSVDMIVQSDSIGDTNDISFTLSKDDLPKATKLLEPVARDIGAKGIETQDGIAKLSIVGIGMRSHSGVAAKMFSALSNGGINIQMISTSEIKTAVIIEEGKISEAANLVHEAFGLSGKS
jgi:aspartate kinase